MGSTLNAPAIVINGYLGIGVVNPLVGALRTRTHKTEPHRCRPLKVWRSHPGRVCKPNTWQSPSFVEGSDQEIFDLGLARFE